jgi:hypothetical protein
VDTRETGPPLDDPQRFPNTTLDDPQGFRTAGALARELKAEGRSVASVARSLGIARKTVQWLAVE